jgi:hypothetical protein
LVVSVAFTLIYPGRLREVRHATAHAAVVAKLEHGFPGPLACVGVVECVEDGWTIVFGPLGEVLDGLDEGATEIGEGVFDSGGHFGVGVAADQAVPDEPAQCLSEDFARDSADEID